MEEIQAKGERRVDLFAEARRAHNARVCLARDDVNTFIELVMKDEKTGRSVVQAPMHEAWHHLAEEHDRLLIWSHTEAGKSSQIAIGRVLWCLGKNPSLRVVILSNTLRGQATKVVRTLKRYIESSDELHEVFPELVPGEPWTDDAITVKRSIIAKDPSVQATGVHGNILGSRIDLLIIDDILDFENTLNERALKDTIDWYQSTVVGRMTKDARAICIGNAWHPKDLLHWLAKNGWDGYRYPVIDDDKDSPTYGKSRWPEQWTLERIAKKRTELGPLEYARNMLCVPRDDTTARFKMEWISKSLARGDGLPLIYRLRTVPAGCRVVTGVDLAVSKKSAADNTAFVTVLEFENQDRRLLEVKADKMSGPEIVKYIVELYQRYHSIFWVESNGAQEYIAQFVTASHAIPVKSFQTGVNKHDPAFGVESLATEFDNGKWIVPNVGGQCHPEIEALIADMLYYDPRSHTGDRLMALWIAREGLRDILEDTTGETGWIDMRR